MEEPMAKRRTSPKAAATKAAAASSSRFHYLVQFSYTAAAWDDLIKNPYKRNRVDAVAALVASLGGCFGQITFPCDSTAEAIRPMEKLGAFGDHDVVALLSFPSDEAAAAFAMAVAAGGGVTHFKTTRVIPWSGVETALTMAASHRASYAPPGKSR
jgi:uncharacterized protein with GYD domain